MAVFILVAGAWHGGWCWERVVPLLEAKGHRALAPDLLGMGADATPPDRLSLAAWADQVAELVRSQHEPVILVGHSRSGTVISEVAERVPERIGILVYLAAFLLPSGESIGSMSARLGPSTADELLMMQSDGTTTLRPERVGPVFYNTTQQEWVDRAISLLRPEPLVALSSPVSLSDAHYGTVRRGYIECENDRAVKIALQRLMLKEMPCDPVLTLPGDHSPFYSDPQALVACLESIAAQT